MCRSVPHTLAASTRTSTSSSPGRGIGTSSSVNPTRGSTFRTALIVSGIALTSAFKYTPGMKERAIRVYSHYEKTLCTAHSVAAVRDARGDRVRWRRAAGAPLDEGVLGGEGSGERGRPAWRCAGLRALAP